MMKRFVLFLLVCLMPSLSCADDTGNLDLDDIGELILKKTVKHAIIDDSVDIDSGVFHDRCENNGIYRDEYTIDRRCYITDEQKKQYPYNAVVGLVEEVLFSYGLDGGIKENYDDVYCTGTIVQNPQDMQLYMYTASHCVSYLTGDNAVVQLQDGAKIKVRRVKNRVGVNLGDVAVYKIPDDYVDNVPFATVDKNAVFENAQSYNLIGYGTLSIMSDKQIHQAKEKYASFFEITESELYADEELINKLAYEILPMDSRLKGSFDCNLSPDFHSTACQAWKGNSGGPIFDKNGNIVAVQAQGWAPIISLRDEFYASTFFDGHEPILPVIDDSEQWKDVKDCIKLCDQTKSCNVMDCLAKMPKPEM